MLISASGYLVRIILDGAMVTLLTALLAAPVTHQTVTDHSCALDPTGHVRCFDVNDHCVQRPPTETLRSFDTVDEVNGCGIRSTDDSVVCWGQGSFVKVPSDVGPIRQLSVSQTHACAVKKDQRLVCWGHGTEGATEAPRGAFLQVSAGHRVSCGVRASGDVACWGFQASTLAPPKKKYVFVAAGVEAACAIDEARHLTCTGALASTPEGKFLTVEVETSIACAAKMDGSAVCFDESKQPFAVGPKGTRFLEVRTRCGRLQSGRVVCWSRKTPELLEQDDGKTVTANAEGTCPTPVGKTVVVPASRRPWVDEVMTRIKDATVDTESERDHVRPEDVPHLAQEYLKSSNWTHKSRLIDLMQDSRDVMLTEVWWDALSVPDCDDDGCWWVRAVALSHLDGDLSRTSGYFENRDRCRAALESRLQERAARKK